MVLAATAGAACDVPLRGWVHAQVVLLVVYCVLTAVDVIDAADDADGSGGGGTPAVTAAAPGVLAGGRGWWPVGGAPPGRPPLPLPPAPPPAASALGAVDDGRSTARCLRSLLGGPFAVAYGLAALWLWVGAGGGGGAAGAACATTASTLYRYALICTVFYWAAPLVGVLLLLLAAPAVAWAHRGRPRGDAARGDRGGGRGATAAEGGDAV